MSGPEGGDPQPVAGEAYLEIKDGEIADGIVLADLDGEQNGDIPPDSDDDEGDEIDDAEGEDNGGASMAQEDLMDDSIHAFEGHTEPVYAVAWSPTGSDVVASGGGDDRAFVWQVGEDAYMETQGATFELTGHTDSVIALAFSSDGTLLASGGMDGCVKVWDPATGTCIQTLEGPGEAIEWVRWHPRGNVVLAGSADFTVWMWLAQTGACMQVFTGHSGPVTCGAFSADGKLVVTGGGEDDATLRVWDPRTGECKVTVHGNHFHGAGLTCLAVHPESAVVVTGAEEGSAKLVALETGRIVGSLVGHEEEGSVEAVAFVPGLNVVATCGMDGKLIVWDVATATARTTCEHPGGVTRMVCHPSQPFIFTGCVDGAVRCWDARTGECTHTFHGHTQAVQDLAVRADGSMVLSGSEDGTCRVFSLN